MLKIISPKGQKVHQPTIEAFLDLLKVYQNFELSETRRKKATFLVAEDNEHGVYGGAVLYPQKVMGSDEEIHDDYEHSFCSAFATYHPEIEEFWIARICFCLEANFSPDGLKGMELCEAFYQELHEAFKAFGQSNESDFIAFSLCTFDAMDPPFYKKWLYLPIWRSNDRSGLLHGILSLTKAKFMPIKKRQPNLVFFPLKQDKFEPSPQGSAV